MQSLTPGKSHNAINGKFRMRSPRNHGVDTHLHSGKWSRRFGLLQESEVLGAGAPMAPTRGQCEGQLAGLCCLSGAAV